MLLFTITPAFAMMPMPVITTPNGWPMIISPSRTPMVDRITADRKSTTERNVAGRGLDAQLVDLIEATQARREAHQDIHRLVVVGGTIFGDLGAVGDELHAGADRVDVGLIFRGLAFVHLDAPVDARQRETV